MYLFAGFPQGHTLPFLDTASKNVGELCCKVVCEKFECTFLYLTEPSTDGLVQIQKNQLDMEFFGEPTSNHCSMSLPCFAVFSSNWFEIR